jgi:hypothetical protein
MLRVLRINTIQQDLLQRMLNAGPDVVRGFRGNRNWLLVREGSDQHQQLLALAEAGAVYRVACAIRGVARWKATCLACHTIGLSEKEVARAVACTGCVPSGRCRGSVLSDQ